MNLVANAPRITAMSTSAIAKVRALEAVSRQVEQIEPETLHVLHGGMYARTIMLQADTVLTGAYINRATMVIVNGHVSVFANNETFEIDGYHVLPASAGRKQAFRAFSDTWMTMIFATDAKTIEEAENLMTDEPEILMSRKDGAVNHILVTGE